MERIQKYINRVYRAAVLDRAAAFSDKNLSGQQISYILQLCRHPGLSNDELSRRLFVNKSSVSRQVAKMIKNGYIYREINKNDRRCYRLFPTEKAKNIYPEIINYLEEWNEQLTGELSNDEQEMLLYLLKQLSRAASERIIEKQLSTMLQSYPQQEGI